MYPPFPKMLANITLSRIFLSACNGPPDDTGSLGFCQITAESSSLPEGTSNCSGDICEIPASSQQTIFCNDTWGGAILPIDSDGDGYDDNWEQICFSNHLDSNETPVDSDGDGVCDHIDYDSDNKIDLKSLKDSFASAANYINKLGWKKGDPCYLKIELNDKVPTTLLNSSAKNIKNKKKLKILKKYIKDPDKIKFDENMKVAIITPDIDIIPDANLLNPAYLVFENYEIIKISENTRN